MMRAPLRLLLVDDEPLARSRLRDLLSDIAEEVPTTVVAEAHDGHSALALIQKHPCDIALVDIRMPGMDGVEFARHLARWPAAPSVIFVTAYDQYAVSAFELAVLDYLVKPVRAARLAVALQKAARHPDEAARLEKSALATRRHLSCLERGRILLVPVADILYLRAEQKYVTARTVEREYLLEESLIRLEDEFADNFVRVHRNCLVASAALMGLERAGAEESKEDSWQVILPGLDERISVSRRQLPLIKKALKPKSQL